MNFSINGWFTLSTLREQLPAELFAKLRDAIANHEIPVTRFGNEYLLDDAELQVWWERAAA